MFCYSLLLKTGNHFRVWYFLVMFWPMFFHFCFAIHLFVSHSMILALLGLCGREGDFHFFIRHSLTRGNSLVPYLIPLQRTQCYFPGGWLVIPLKQQNTALSGRDYIFALQTCQTGSIGPLPAPSVTISHVYTCTVQDCCRTLHARPLCCTSE